MPTKWILFAFTFQHTAIAYLIGLLSLVVRITKWPPRFEGTGILSLEFRKRVKSRYSITILRAIFWGTDFRRLELELDESHEQHERVHIRQIEDACMQGFALGAVLAAFLASFGWYAEAWQPFAVWELTWLLTPLATIANPITALMRYGVPGPGDNRPKTWIGRAMWIAYEWSEHERSARAQTEFGRVDNFWLREERKRRG